MLGQELPYGFRITLRQLSKRPRHRLHNHVIAIFQQQLANLDRAPSVAASAAGLAVQGHGAHQRCAPPPTVLRAGPTMNQLVWHLTFAPCRSCKVASEHIYRAPATHTSPKLS